MALPHFFITPVPLLSQILSITPISKTIHLNLFSQASSSPEATMMTKMISRLLDDYLNELAYAAELAGLRYTVSHTLRGMKLSFSGYSHKLHQLVHHVLDRLTSFKVGPQTLRIVC